VKKQRLDILIVERGLAESRSIAQRLVMAGRVRINGQTAYKPGMSVATQSEITIDAGAEFVSRGGEKLAAALEAFKPKIQGQVCADVGASTGGFTDCLLQHGAAKVYAIDVGHGILAWNLRQDERVVIMERQNARHIERLPELVNLITVDVSFISLKVLLPVFKGWFGITLTPQPLLPKSGDGANVTLSSFSPHPELGEG
jgi:23S rRNA (cytidine1920-2'-O)/16S rRNA (cytidine1409-2'-O)-methyltransferase